MSGEDINSKEMQIVQAAIEVFSGKLFHKVTVDEIAYKAGVGKGTIYLYFNSKEDLFRRVLQYATELYYLNIKESTAEEKDCSSKLRKFISLHLEMVEEQLKVIYLLIAESMAPPQVFAEEIEKARAQILFLVEDILEEGIKRGEFRVVDTTVAAKLFQGGLLSLAHDAFYPCKNLQDLAEEGEKFWDLFKGGIAVK